MQSAKDILINAMASGSAIPAVPAVLERLAAICRDPSATARDLAKVIQMDANLAAKILKRVNSSFYGLSAQIKTITHAVVILGFHEIKHMALAFPVASLFKAQRNKGLDINKLWEWTLTVACIAKALSYHVAHPVPEQVFVSAILGKTGMLVMSNELGERYRVAVGPILETEQVPFVEKTRFEVSHVQIGWILARQWKFPDELLDAIAYQYNPTPRVGFKREAGLIYAARRFHLALQEGADLELTLADFPPEVSEGFALTPEVARAAVERAHEEYAELKKMLEN